MSIYAYNVSVFSRVVFGYEGKTYDLKVVEKGGKCLATFVL